MQGIKALPLAAMIAMVVLSLANLFGLSLYAYRAQRIFGVSVPGIRAGRGDRLEGVLSEAAG